DRAADLDHDRLAGKLADIRMRLDQRRRFVNRLAHWLSLRATLEKPPSLSVAAQADKQPMCMAKCGRFPKFRELPEPRSVSERTGGHLTRLCSPQPRCNASPGELSK